jgi:hydrogenase maturation factor HypF (carbamoyltransferase family)
VADTCRRLAQRCGTGTVALGGGVFCNALLVAEASARIEAAGLTCLARASSLPATEV